VKLHVVSVCGFSVVALLMSTGVAVASGSIIEPWGELRYDSSVNILRVTDKQCDGMPVYAHLRARPNNAVVLRAGDGCSATVATVIGIPDGTPISYRLCLGSPALVQCTPWREDRA
jgi:hypothetical protein